MRQVSFGSVHFYQDYTELVHVGKERRANGIVYAKLLKEPDNAVYINGVQIGTSETAKKLTEFIRQKGFKQMEPVREGLLKMLGEASDLVFINKKKMARISITEKRGDSSNAVELYKNIKSFLLERIDFNARPLKKMGEFLKIGDCFEPEVSNTKRHDPLFNLIAGKEGLAIREDIVGESLKKF